jgi:DNA-directed RNA polymerase subunit E"
MEKACLNCRYITTQDKCPACGSEKLTKQWEGYIIIINPDSEVAKVINAKTTGRYALKIKKGAE